MSINESFSKEINEEKVYHPFRVFKRFYKGFFFPGAGHFFSNIKPLNILFPVVGIVLLGLTVFFGISSSETKSRYTSLRYLSSYFIDAEFKDSGRVASSWDHVKDLIPRDQNLRMKKMHVLVEKKSLENIIRVFEREGGLPEAALDSLRSVMPVTEVCSGEIKETQKRIHKAFSKRMLQERVDETDLEKDDVEADYVIPCLEDVASSASVDEAELMKERDQEIVQAREDVIAKYEKQVRAGLAQDFYTFLMTPQGLEKTVNLTLKYKARSFNLFIKFVLLIVTFFIFWGYTLYDLSKIINYGKLDVRIGKVRTAFGFLGLNVVGFSVFLFGPVIFSLILAFNQWDILTDRVFVGISNFQKLFSDPFFWKYLGNTLFFFINIPLGMATSVLLALALNQKIKGITFYRVIYYLPVVSSMVAVALLWRWIYNPDFGLLNTFLKSIGIANPPSWLSSTLWAKPAITIMGVWKGVGSGMLLYLAALQGIPGHLYESADIDGANGWNQFLHITLPLLGPTHFFRIVTGVIDTFKQFGAQYVMTQGGPAGSTTTIVYYIYNNAFQWFKMGYASAIAWVLFAFIFVATVINWRYTGDKLYT